MNTIYLALSTAVVLVFSFVFYKTRTESATAPAMAAVNNASTLFFTTPVAPPPPVSQSADIGSCMGGCSWTETSVGYATIDPYYQDIGTGTLPYDMQSSDIIDNLPIDFNNAVSGQSSFISGQSTTIPESAPSFTVTPDPVVDFIPDQTMY